MEKKYLFNSIKIIQKALNKSFNVGLAGYGV